VLDVGCGSGKLVRFLRDRGVEAYGVEPAEALFARFLAGDGRFFRDIDAAAAAAGRPFALVLALDVLEHVEDPVAFLGSLSVVAAPDGRVVVSTPDAGSLVARALGRRWHHYNRFHLSLLAPPTLARAGLRAGPVEHPGRYRSAGYVARYLFEFGFRRPSPGWVAALDRRFFAINLRDTMLASLEVARPGA
jgi:SAM-dependent methyltransferase